MSQYDTLDRLIVAAIERKKNPLYDGSVATEAARLAAATGRDDYRVTDARLQALRKKNRIQHLTNVQAKALDGGKAGWRVVPQSS